MFKPIAIAFTVGLAALSTAAWADDTNRVSSTSQTSMQRCVTEAKAKNDGTSDTEITRVCTSKMSNEKTRTDVAAADESSSSTTSTTRTKETATTSDTDTTPVK